MATLTSRLPRQTHRNIINLFGDQRIFQVRWHEDWEDHTTDRMTYEEAVAFAQRKDSADILIEVNSYE